MDTSRLWGLLGIVLGVAGLALIAPEVLATVRGGAHDPVTGALITAYGVGVLVSVVATVLVVLPDIARPGAQ